MRRIPLIQTPALMECGPTSLAMVLAYFGRSVPLDELVAMTRSAYGSDAATLIQAGERHGLTGRAVQVDIDQLVALPRASILHWEFRHFVVLDRVLEDGIRIVDPIFGRRRVAMEELRRCLTGVALIFEPSATFVRRAAPAQLGRYFKDLLRDRAVWLQVVVASLLLQASTLALPLIAGWVIDYLVPTGQRALLTSLAVALGALVLFHLVTGFVRGALLVALRARIDMRLSAQLISHAAELPLEYFETKNPGDLVARFRSPAAIRDALTSTALSGLLDGSLLVAYLAFILYLDPYAAACVALFGALLAGVLTFTRGRMKDLAAEELYRSNRAFAYLVDLLHGIETIKAMGNQATTVRRYVGELTHHVNATQARESQQSAWEAVVGALRLACPLAVLGLGTWRALAGQVTVGHVLAATTLASGFFLPLSSLFGTVLSLELIEQHVRYVQDIMATAPEQDPARRRPAPELRGEVSLEGACFQYPGAGGFRLEDCTVRIRAGEFVAIVGRSGSGKSTFAKLLVGLYTPTTGRVTFDGIDLRELELDSVRRQIGFVPQRPSFMTDSIRRIIAGGRTGITLDQVMEASRIAHIHDEVSALTLGYETALNPEGGALSGGQRQRVALARALVGNPRFLLLDEATSALDSQTELAVQGELAALSCTRIVVAHRLSSVVRADRILVMSAGRIVDEGRHEELSSRPGLYRELIAGQLAAGTDGEAFDKRASG